MAKKPPDSAEMTEQMAELLEGLGKFMRKLAKQMRESRSTGINIQTGNYFKAVDGLTNFIHHQLTTKIGSKVGSQDLEMLKKNVTELVDYVRKKEEMLASFKKDSQQS